MITDDHIRKLSAAPYKTSVFVSFVLAGAARPDERRNRLHFPKAVHYRFARE